MRKIRKLSHTNSRNWPWPKTSLTSMPHQVLLSLPPPSPALLRLLCRLGTFRQGKCSSSIYSSTEGVELRWKEESVKGSGRIDVRKVAIGDDIKLNNSSNDDNDVPQLGMRLKVSGEKTKTSARSATRVSASVTLQGRPRPPLASYSVRRRARVQDRAAPAPALAPRSWHRSR